MTATLFANQAPRLWLRVEQDGDKGFYAQIPPDTADGFVVNANLIEHSPGSVSAFLDKLERPFIIDPISYRFDRPAWHTRERDGLVDNKRNYARLWQKYAKDVDGLSGDPLRDHGIREIASEQALLRFCSNVIDFQDRRLRAEWLDDGSQYVGMDRLFGFQLAPSAYVAPYLVIGEGEPTADIEAASNLVAATVSLGRPPVVAVLPIRPSVLADIDCMRRLAGRMAWARVNSALIWPVGVSAFELAESPELFTGLAVLIRGLHDGGVEAGLLYGGFFSTLLRAFGASGFSHALMYGESRDLEPTNGRPSTRFYFPPLHDFFSYSVTQQLLAGISPEDYLALVCDCDICRTLVAEGLLGSYFETYVPDGAKRPFPTSSALDLNRFHYLFARRNELAFARTRPEPQLIADLMQVVDRFPPPATRVLRAWAVRLRSA
jgi:hypothetical protein